MSKLKKKGRIAKAPLTRIEILTQGLMQDPQDVKANFTIKEDEKGRGVYLKIPELPKGSFVLEYEGDIITHQEIEWREKLYASNGEGCFILEFRYNDKRMAIDATRNFNSYTRLLNHSREPNIKFHSPIVVDFTEPIKPRIAAYALRDIKRGEEIVFDYGVNDRSIPWLKNRKIGYADVSDDEYDDEDDNASKDSEGSSSEGGYLCLRYTAARASRLEGDDAKPAFNYKEYSRSGSSSSDVSSMSGRRKKYEWAPNSLTVPSSDQSTSTNTPQSSVHWGARACRWEFKRVSKRNFEISLSSIPLPQKILKCLEPKPKSKKADCVDSVIYLSDASSPSQESTSRSDPKEFHSIPEVSSQTKVLDWQKNLCTDDNNLNIKIVDVQSLCDSPEHAPSSEPSYQMSDGIMLEAVVSLERLEDVAYLEKSKSPTYSVSAHPASSSSFVEASSGLPFLFPLPQEQQHCGSVHKLSQSETLHHLPPTMLTTQQTPEITQDISSYNANAQHKSNSLPSNTLQNHDLSTSSKGSSFAEVPKPALKPESPVIISDSEDQHPCDLSLSKGKGKSQSKLQESALYFAPRKPNTSVSDKFPAHVQLPSKASTSGNLFHSSPNNFLVNQVQTKQEYLVQSQKNHVLRQSQTDRHHQISPLNHNTSNPSQKCPRNPHSFQTGSHQLDHQSSSQQPQVRKLGQRKDKPPGEQSHTTRQQYSHTNTMNRTNNVTHRNKNLDRNKQTLNNRALHADQCDSLVISDEEDTSLQKKGNSVNSTEQNVLVLSSGDESDVEEAPPTAAQSYVSTSRNNVLKPATKFEAVGNSLNAPIHPSVADSECELIHVDHLKPSTPRQVAVIQPFKSVLIDNNASESSNALTCEEKDHLGKIFDRRSLSKNVSKEDINDKIYKHWHFFQTILERGVSIEQIRAAVKHTCLDKHNRSMRKATGSSKSTDI
ncbi:histone-lysine N-methyltransferase [Elysia marginata]|uniref:Histone-lysine N-methyltransferase n=1 Tax=Elysia marginata TaxID=1093978 RepID=A0AAV4K266_9GAST|nr:histone-lysine N-methyltransferase [Elysia marginata]